LRLRSLAQGSSSSAGPFGFVPRRLVGTLLLAIASVAVGQSPGMGDSGGARTGLALTAHWLPWITEQSVLRLLEEGHPRTIDFAFSGRRSQRFCVRLIERLGARGRVLAIKAIVRSLDDVRPGVADASIRALVALVRRHEGVRMRGLLCESIASPGLAAMPRTRALHEVLGVDPALDDSLLAALIRRGQLADPSTLNAVACRLRDLAPGSGNDALRSEVQEHLRSPSEPLRRTAALAAGWIRDEGSAPLLCELLDSDDQQTRNNAAWSLSRIFGVQILATRTIWTDWLNKEEQWWSRNGARVLGDLRSREPARIAAGLREAGNHPYFRHQWVTGLAHLARHESDPIRVAVCNAIKGLGTKEGTELLAELSQDGSELVREAASAAIAELQTAR
jgi:hypothetical protein